MPILNRYNNDPILGELQTLLGDQLKRLDELYLGVLNEHEIDFAIFELAMVDPHSFNSFVKPALDTNQGMSRTIQEGLGFSNGKDLRVKARSFAILHTVTVQMEMLPRTAGQGIKFDIKKEVQTFLKKGDITTVKAACDAAIADIQDKKAQNDLSIQQRHDKEAEEADRARKEEKKRKQIAAQQMWAKHLNPYKERLERRKRKEGNVEVFMQGMVQAKKFKNQIKTVGVPVLETAAKAAEQKVLTYLRSAKGAKFNEFQQNWNTAGAELKKIGVVIDDANKEFMDAVGKDDANFQAARDFKVKCIKGVFEAVKSYAPAPFNLVGTVGIYFMDWAAEATETVATTWEYARAQTANDQDIQGAMDAAEKTVQQTKNRIFMDHGVSTQTQAGEISSVAKIDCVLNTAAATFYHELAQIKAGNTASKILGTADVQSDIKTQLRAIASGPNATLILNDGQIKDGAKGLKAAVQLFADGVMTPQVVKEQSRIESEVSKIKVPKLAVSNFGDDAKLKRYLILYLTGVYIQEKYANNKHELFVLQTNISKLLKESGFLHAYTDSTDRKQGYLGMSLPWVLANSGNKTGLIFKSTHHSYSVRVNMLLRQYAGSQELNPFAAMVDRKSAGDIEIWLKGKDKNNADLIVAAKKKSKGRVKQYLSMQESL